ncbi:hypothetical protein SNEBB_000753 [Seison nebaliae]|nr:hypothetical protein SNEBB_000753 [Seison nebaliae]
MNGASTNLNIGPEIDPRSGRTRIEFLKSSNIDNQLYISRHSSNGFILNEIMRTYGSLCLFPTKYYNWKVKDVNNIPLEAFDIFKVLDKKLDILLLGKGDAENMIENRLYSYLRNDLGLTTEILPTVHAISTYNFLMMENRLVCGLFHPHSELFFRQK